MKEYLRDRTKALSAHFYNAGLQLAGRRALSGAETALRRALMYDKSNSDARNLLGLVYFECGRVPDAIKHWVISTNIRREGNIAAEYLERVQRNTEEFENYGEAIMNFNDALVCVNQKNEDVAVVRLKKALELNPSFVNAHNLLCFCLLTLKDRDRALISAEKALALDADNPVALNYARELTGGSVRKKPQPRPQEEPAKAFSAPIYARRGGGSKLAQAVVFISGVAVTFLYFLILVMPRVLSEKNTRISELSAKAASMAAERDQIAKERDETVGKLSAESDKLSGEAASLRERLLLSERAQKINTAQSLQRTGKASDLENAADLLYSVDGKDLPEESKQLYDALTAQIYPAVARNLYNSGVSHYNGKEYDDAKVDLEKTLQFADADSSYRSGALYYFGLIAEAQDDAKTALSYYDRLTADFPQSNFSRSAESRRSRLAAAGR